MKSNKQRRAEIKLQRLARAGRAAAKLQGLDWRTLPDARTLRLLGAEPADAALLASHNADTYDLLPAFYPDRPFRCRDCGAEQVWTAKQQKWWYEVIGARLSSGAVRCLPCRRARRAELARAASVPGANRLQKDVDALRAAAASGPTAEAVALVDAGLQSKWDGVRKVAIDVLGAWKRPKDKPYLKQIVMTDKSDFSPTRRAALKALLPLLVHPKDDLWVLEVLAGAGHHLIISDWAFFVRAIAPSTLESFVVGELGLKNSHRLERLRGMLSGTGLQLSDTTLLRLRQRPSKAIASALRPPTQPGATQSL